MLPEWRGKGPAKCKTLCRIRCNAFGSCICGMGHLRKETQESVDSDAFGSRTGEVDWEMG